MKIKHPTAICPKCQKATLVFWDTKQKRICPLCGYKFSYKEGLQNKGVKR